MNTAILAVVVGILLYNSFQHSKAIKSNAESIMLILDMLKMDRESIKMLKERVL